MSTTVRLSWPGSQFRFRHGGQTFTVSPGEFECAKPLAQRLLSKYCANGMVVVPEDKATAEAVQDAAELRGEHAHRMAGQNRLSDDVPAAGRVGRGSPGTRIPEVRQAIQAREDDKRQKAEDERLSKQAAADKRHADRLERAKTKAQSRILRGGKALKSEAAPRPVGVAPAPPKPGDLQPVVPGAPEGGAGKEPGPAADMAETGAGATAEASGEASASTPGATPGAPPPEA